MSAPRLNPASKTIKEPSTRAKSRVAEAQAYGARKIDPVLDDAIEFMLIDRPMTIMPRLYEYLQSVKEGKPLVPEDAAAKTPEEVLGELKPVIEKLIGKAITDWDMSSDKKKAEDAMMGNLVDHMKILVEESVASIEV